MYKNWKIHSKNGVHYFHRPAVMGILNITPDSFFADSRATEKETIAKRMAAMIEAGADIIDIGPQSTRPGAEFLSANEELKRLMPVLDVLPAFAGKALFSIDTFYSQTAKRALDHGFDFINDVSAGQFDSEIWKVAAEYNCSYVLMHMQGTPQTMQIEPRYDDVVSEVQVFFREKMAQLAIQGVHHVIVDPGFGFGKTTAHNFQLLNHLDSIAELGCPLLAGMSRKRMIREKYGTSEESLVAGSMEVHLRAIEKGAQIVRVHDVAPMVQALLK